MKFTLIKDLKQDSTMKPIITGLLLFMLFYLIADIFVKQSSFGILPQTIEFTLFGNEEEFLDPISSSSFLEFVHSEIFFTMMILLTLSAVFARVSNKAKVIVINTVMITAVISLLSIISSFYISKSFIYLYAVCFSLWHLIALYMILYSLWKLNAKSI